MNLDMSKFYNLEGQSVVVEAALDDLRPVHEGWGDLIATVGSMIFGGVAGGFAGFKIGEALNSDFAGGILGRILGTAGAVGGITGYLLLTQGKLEKIAKHPEVQKYLTEQAKIIFKEEKKKDKSIVTDYAYLEKDLEDNDMDEKETALDRDMAQGFIDACKYFRRHDIKIGDFHFILVGDTKEVKKIFLLLYSKDYKRLFAKSVPVPSSEEIKAMTSKVQESATDIEGEAVTEGWGAALAKLLGFSAVGAPLSTIFTKLHLKILTNPDDDFTTMAKKSIAVGVCGLVLNIAADIAANKAIDLQASKKLLEALNKPEMVEHIKTEAAKAFKELKKEHKSLTLDVENALKEKANTKEASKDERGFITRFLTYYAKCTAKIDKYTVFATGDFKSFDSLYVIFFDEEEGKIIRKALPIPSVKAEEAPKEEA